MLAAAVACAPSGSFEQSCHECKRNPEMRAKWGCDAPLSEPVITLHPCPACGGQDPECEHCSGTNDCPIHRCPHALVEPVHFEVLRDSARAEQGILPEAGGWIDQANCFTQAWPIAMQELNHWREVARERASRQAEQKSQSRR